MISITPISIHTSWLWLIDISFNFIGVAVIAVKYSKITPVNLLITPAFDEGPVKLLKITDFPKNRLGRHS
jgi:hypothetical protein